MKLNDQKIAAIRNMISKSIPQLSINTVIFRFSNDQMQFAAVRLIQGNKWLIPGGYIYQNESIDEAARRNLFEQTKIDHLVLNQFGSFGSSDRRMAEDNSDIDSLEMPDDIRQWITARFVTIAYYSIMSDPGSEISIDTLYDQAKWLNVENHEELAMDHSEIVAEARKTLAKDLLSQPILLSFLPSEFTIPELQKLYEAILDRRVDRGNFRKRILKLGFLEKTGQLRGNAKQRPPELYRIDVEKYQNSLTEDVKLGF